MSDKWFGVVVDRNDPKKMGRVRVRLFGQHTHDHSETGIPSEDLPWSLVSLPCTVTDKSSHALQEGSWVHGIILDDYNQTQLVEGIIEGYPTEVPEDDNGFSDLRLPSKERWKGLFSLKKSPIRLLKKVWKNITEGKNYDGKGIQMQEVGGTLGDAGKPAPRDGTAKKKINDDVLNDPDLSRFARNEKIDELPTGPAERNQASVSVPMANGRSWQEPPYKSGAIYPFNKVYESESGHIIEIDDTPGAERINVYHRSGSFFEITEAGDVNQKSVRDTFQSTVKNTFSHIDGESNTTVDKGFSLYVGADGGLPKNYTGNPNGMVRFGKSTSCDVLFDGGTTAKRVKLSLRILENGNLDVSLDKGDITVKSKDGNVDVELFKGNLNVTLESGDVKYNVMNGSFDVQASQGIRLNSDTIIQMGVKEKTSMIMKEDTIHSQSSIISAVADSYVWQCRIPERTQTSITMRDGIIKLNGSNGVITTSTSNSKRLV